MRRVDGTDPEALRWLLGDAAARESVLGIPPICSMAGAHRGGGASEVLDGQSVGTLDQAPGHPGGSGSWGNPRGTSLSVSVPFPAAAGATGCARVGVPSFRARPARRGQPAPRRRRTWHGT